MSGGAGHPCKLLILAVLAAEGGACSREAGPQRIIAQEMVLRRQIDGLQQLIAAAERGELLPRDKLVVAVSEQLVIEIAQLALPREQVIEDRFRVRLEKIDVRFRDKDGSVRLDGRVSPARGSPDEVFAELAVFGLLHSVAVEPETGVLSAKVQVIGFELSRVGVYGDSAAGRRLLEELARQRLEALESLALPITIPVRVDQEIALPGVGGDGPVRLRPVKFPLTVKVTEVTAHGQRLWVALEVSSGSWVKADTEVREP